MKFDFCFYGILGCLFFAGCGVNPEKSEADLGAPHLEASIDTSKLTYEQLKAIRQEWESTWLAPEMEARVYEKQVNEFWDSLLDGASFWDLMAGFTPELMEMPSAGEVQTLDENRFLTLLNGGGDKLTGDDVLASIEKYRNQGWEIAQQEFRMFGFRADPVHPESDVQVRLYAENKKQGRRSFISGTATVTWKKSDMAEGAPNPHQIIWKEGYLAGSTDFSPRFVSIFDEEIEPVASSQFIDPLIIGDLNKDGSDEIILLGGNQILTWDDESGFKQSPIISVDALLEAGMILDVDSDGLPDLVSSTHGSLLVFHGQPEGGFNIPPTISEIANLELPTAMAAADVNQDGLVDIWLGQYLGPFEEGLTPKPFDDADDGLPSYLLLNQGEGKFIDITEGSGLDEKRNRRAFTGVFVDFDTDGLIDFVQVNDFQGLDYYKGIEPGKFSLKTQTVLGETRGFGMSHQVADFNGDSNPDLCMIGMVSSTATRMGTLGVNHPDFPTVIESRKQMTHGNRIWLNQENDQWMPMGQEASFRDTGWAWGNCFSDFDNDGRGEFYIANGHMTNQSSEDMEGEYWRFEVYTAGPMAEAMSRYLTLRGQRMATESISIGGHHHNAFLNQTPLGWMDLAWLDGIAIPEDCLNTASLDVNQDGALDLVVISKSVVPESVSRVKVFQNKGSSNHWIGVRFNVEDGQTIWGSRVDLKMKNGSTQTSWVLSSQGFRTQPGAFAHFGLGSDSEVASVTVTWPDSSTTEIASPKADQWIRVKREGN